MDYFSTTSKASRRASGCIIIGIYAPGNLGVAASDVDAATGGAIRKLVKQGDILTAPGKCTVLPSLPGVRAQRIAVVGLGSVSKFGIKRYRQAVAAAIVAIRDSKTQEIVNYLTLEKVGDTSAYYLARYAVETIGNVLYAFTDMKSGRKPAAAKIKRIGQAIAHRGDAAKSARGAEHAHAIVEGMTLCRDLGNLPPNICTPTYLARTAQRLARQHAKLETRVVNESEMKRLGMHSLLSVTAGADTPAKLIVMQYKGTVRERPVVLVGKGITFDSGGITLKSGPAMDEMKFDMCGAAAVIGTMAAVARLKLPLNLTVVIPACENLPSGTATRPGDIVQSMSGQTIEILNTDAEGRLILCDALTYSRRFKPALMIDVATLTGACVVALGHHLTAVMSKSDEIARSITAAGAAADDRSWHMPMADEYENQLSSNFADFANVGGRDGGAITAACFLGKFTDGVDWAHLDIAGTAWVSGTRKGATGRPVPMLTQLLLSRTGLLP